MSKILLLAKEILSQGEMRGIKREIDWAKEAALTDEDNAAYLEYLANSCY